MIKVYLRRDDPGSADIEARLRKLVVAHTIFYGDERPDSGVPVSPIPENLDPPLLVDDDTVVHGREEILTHMGMLERFLAEWSKFQSDACYCDANGNPE
jgi:hypothetical protein